MKVDKDLMNVMRAGKLNLAPYYIEIKRKEKQAAITLIGCIILGIAIIIVVYLYR